MQRKCDQRPFRTRRVRALAKKTQRSKWEEKSCTLGLHRNGFCNKTGERTGMQSTTREWFQALVVKVESSARAMDVKAELLFINNDLHHWSLRASLKQQIWLRHKNARRHKNPLHTQINAKLYLERAHTQTETNSVCRRVKFYRSAQHNLLIFPPSFYLSLSVLPQVHINSKFNFLWIVARKKNVVIPGMTPPFSDQ